MRRRGGPRWYGVVLAIILPALGALMAMRLAPGDGLSTFFVGFLMAVTLGHIGMAVADWQVIPIFWIRDVLIGAAMAVVSWAVGRYAGGGRVDPALMALVGTYLLLIWPSEARRRWS